MTTSIESIIDGLIAEKQNYNQQIDNVSNELSALLDHLEGAITAEEQAQQEQTDIRTRMAQVKNTLEGCKYQVGLIDQKLVNARELLGGTIVNDSTA